MRGGIVIDTSAVVPIGLSGNMVLYLRFGKYPTGGLDKLQVRYIGDT